MPTEKRVPSLIVNTLTEAQYQELENPSDTEMWVTPYDESILPDQTGQSGKFLTTDGTDASWADLSIPANIYTQDNLIAGNDISLTDVSDIDSDTMMLMHFNESLADSSQYNTTLLQKTTGGTTWTANPTYQDGKFGKGLKIINSSISSPEWTNTAFSQINDEMTVDFWLYYDPNKNSICNIRIYSGNKYTNFELYFYQNSLYSYIGGLNGSGSIGGTSFKNQLVAGAWNHVALCLKSGTSKSLFANGKLVATDNSYVLNFGNGISRIVLWNGGYAQIDELRISKVIRWTSDFTLPTAPYGQPTGQKKIDCTLESLPSQTGQSGKYLTTDGSAASWAAIPATVSADGTTIENNSNVLTTIGVKDQNTSNAIKTWTGTKAQYDAIVTKDADTIYNITDDTVLADFANTSLSNLTNAGKIVGAGLGMPSSTYIDLTLGASDSTYTAPADGWVLIGKRCTGNQYLGTYNNVIMHRLETWSSSYCFVFFPVRKGDVFPVSYTAAGVTEVFRFVYAEGSKSEAN